MNFRNFPKIELHLHLDGSVRTSTVSEILNMDINNVNDKMIATNCNNLNEYLEKFELPLQILNTKENLTRVAKELAEDLKNDGVIYAEIRFAPILHMNNGLTGEEVIEAILEGLRKVDIKTNLILCLMRNSDYEDNMKVIELGEKYYMKGVVAFDLAGAEGVYKTETFEKYFKTINDLNIPFTIHAGEADGPGSVLAAIKFGANRIGHGVRSIEDDEVVNLLKNNSIPLEVCPTSNIDTKVYNNYYEHKIKELYDRDILVTINTDDRTVSNISLSLEYEKLHNTFNFSIEEFKNMNLVAIENSFISKEEKLNLKEEYLKLYNKYIIK